MKFATFATLAATAVVALAAPAAEIEARQSCSGVYLYFARGTGEAQGLGILGEPLQTRLRLSVGAVTEAVVYPADVAGFLIGGSPEGARNMAAQASSIIARCPNAKVFLGGYSQGAQVAHLAAARLSSAEQNRITGVVTFGDPKRDDRLPGNLENRRKTFCNFGDLICSGSSVLLAPHFTYGSDVPEAADWIVDRV